MRGSLGADMGPCVFVDCKNRQDHWNHLCDSGFSFKGDELLRYPTSHEFKGDELWLSLPL